MNLLLNNLKIVIAVVLISCILSCEDTSTTPNTGVVKVSVIDNDGLETPVPDVEIKLLPINKTAVTDSNGICNFYVRSGNYIVSAEVCCLGPGKIEYDVPVNVTNDNTSIVELMACLSCQ